MKRSVRSGIALVLFLLAVPLAAKALPGDPGSILRPGTDEVRAGGEELVVIDSAIAEYELLAEEVGRERRVVVLDAKGNGLGQLAAAVKNRRIKALHIISHGAPGRLLLGGSMITPANLSPAERRSLALVGKSLAEDADILVYGCTFGAGKDGEDAMLALARATGADVGGSLNATGHASLKGDWVLERQVGLVETQPCQAGSWHGLLLYCVDVNCQVDTTDSDGDGLYDCRDACPDDPNNECGADLCPDDPLKDAPGVCGCGVPDTNSDSDHYADCLDAEPENSEVWDPLTCTDLCPDDPLKTDPGICGCGVADIDTDNDGTPDCNDSCPQDMDKIAPGICGCGVADIDTDNDGTPDCNDSCPQDMNKIDPGVCGCGAEELDSNNDGITDCGDLCPDNPDKNLPGECGCAVADTDSDNDGTPDCNDSCPHDMNKIEPGICGCGVEDSTVDANNNGTPDCRDFPWLVYLHNFLRPPVCGQTPDYCYMVADGDNRNSTNSPLFKYTFSTDSLELLGHLGVDNVEAIVLSLDASTLYGTDNGVFGIIDTTPGATNSFTPLNSNGVGSGNGSMGMVSFDDIDGLAFDPSTGVLYGSVRRQDGGRGVDLLIKIDHQRGTVIKDGFGAGVDYVVIDTAAVGLFDTDDMTIDSDGRMYGIAAISGGGGGDRLVSIDKETGAVTDLGELTTGVYPVQDMEGLTFYHGTTLYGTTGFEFNGTGTSNTLYRIDKAGGSTTMIRRLDDDFNGLVPSDFESITCPVCR